MEEGDLSVSGSNRTMEAGQSMRQYNAAADRRPGLRQVNPNEIPLIQCG